MAPADRREHRQQRVRGAGASTVQASFGFNFGALGAKALPPQPPRRRSRTPVQGTPRLVNESAKRHRSASAPRSTKSQRNSTPRNNNVTPQIRKRKHESLQPASTAENEEDELSPDRVENVHSAEKRRRVVRTVSPVRDETDEAPDELSVIDDPSFTARKTPDLMTGLTTSKRAGASDASTQSASRRSLSRDLDPVTPGMQPHSSSRHSFVLSTTVENTASNASQAEDEYADELSPPQASANTTRNVSRKSIPKTGPSVDEEEGVDELSPVQVLTRAPVSGATSSAVQDTHNGITATPIPIRSVARGRSRKPSQTKETNNVVTPATRTVEHGRNTHAATAEESDDAQQDELSPETGRTKQTISSPVKRTSDEAHVVEDDSDIYEEESETEEAQESTPGPVAARTSSKQVPHAKSLSNRPPPKRQRFVGPKLAVSVMRIKGYGVRGITAADTTRTLLEESIDHRLGRMLDKMQTSQDSTRRKELRSEVNLTLSFKESLNEKLLDLQDANDVLTANAKKMKMFKRNNAELRKKILTLQNARHEVSLEHDDIQAEFEAEKATMETRDALSANLFDIETAIHNGRKKAKQEKREHEGPNVPLSMLLETVSRNVGSTGGGLLAGVKSFNGALERAASWLEGRA